MRVPLNESRSIFLDGSGNGTVKLGPISAREVWYPDVASVSANPNPTNDAQCTIYVGLSATQSYFKDACIDGSTGDSTGNVSGSVVRCGSYVWAVWTGGDSNVQATLTVTGTKEV